MRIGVDIRMLSGGVMSGVPEYAANLLAELTKHPATFKLFYSGQHKQELDFPWLERHNVELYDFSVSNRLLFLSARTIHYPRTDTMLGGVDVFFSPHFYFAPVSRDVPVVLTLHDLSFAYQHPFDFFPRKMKYWHALMAPRRQAERARHIITVSRSTKEDIIQKYHQPADKVSVIYSGVSPMFRPLAEDDPLLRAVRKKYHLPEKFIFSLSTIEPRKNISQVVAAFTALKRQKEFADYGLVIAGQWGWNYQDIAEAISRSPFRKDIILPGFVYGEEKLALYNLSAVFVYPSFFEGFGFPPLEAMACGVPVVGALDSSLGEVIGAAGLLVDPFNVNDLTFALSALLADHDLRQMLRERGLANARRFSWAKSAAETFAVLQRVYRENYHSA